VGAATSARLRPEAPSANEAFEVASIRPREEAAFRRATIAALPGGLNQSSIERASKGTFDIELNAAPVIRNPAIQAEVLATGIEFDAPPLEQALREQLGLRLEPTRLDIEILVIDRVQEPEPN